MVGGDVFRLPHDLSHSTLLYSIHFSSPVTLCFKKGTFTLRFSRYSRWKYGQDGFFFRLTYVEPKHQSDQHNQAGANDFQRLIWIFWICCLSPAKYNVDHSQCLDLIAINFNWSTRPWSIVQGEISSMKLGNAFDMFNQSQHLLHTLNKSFFMFRLHFYLSWNTKA